MLNRIAQYPRSLQLSRNAWILLGATVAVMAAAGLAIALNADLRERLFQAQAAPGVTKAVSEQAVPVGADEVTRFDQAQTAALSEGDLTADADNAPDETDSSEPASPAGAAGVALDGAIQLVTHGFEGLGVNFGSERAPSGPAGATP